MVDLNLLQNEARQRHEGNAEPMVQRHQIGFNENTRTIGLHMKVLHRKAAEALMTPMSFPGIPYTSNPLVAFSASKSQEGGTARRCVL